MVRILRALAVLVLALAVGCSSRSTPELGSSDAGAHRHFGASGSIYSAPYALAQVSINSAAPVTGGQVVAGSATIALTGVSTQGWNTALWELYDYPSGWSTPSGWTRMSTGVIQYTASNSSVNPPAFTLPSTSTWGKWAIRLTVNNGIDPTGTGPNLSTGAPNPRMVDTTLALSMYAPSSLHDMFVGENAQFGGTPAEAWVHDYKANLRVLDTFINSGGGGGGGGGSSGPLVLEELGSAFGSPTYSGLANRILLIDPTGGYTLTPVSGTMGAAGSWLRIQLMPGVTVSGTNFLKINPVSGGKIQQVITNQNVISTSQIQVTTSVQSGGSFSFFSDGSSPPNMYVLP